MSDTAGELSRILADIESKTGVEVYLASRGGEEYRFFVDWNGKKTEVFLAGSGPAAEREAGLVNYLVANTDASRIPAGRQDFLRSVLLGEGGSWQAFRYLTKYNLADAPCFALDLLPDRRMEEALVHTERCVDERDLVVRMDDKRLAVVRFSGEGQNAYSFGQFLCQSLYEETGIHAHVGVGCEMKSFGEIAVSYHQAATAVRMSGILQAKGQVHTYREYLLVRMLEDIPREKLKDYLDQFSVAGAEDILDDEDMAGTAEEFLESSLNISETSRNLFMHRNTLMYRLDKIERATGLNIRKFSDAVTFRVITILYKLLQA